MISSMKILSNTTVPEVVLAIQTPTIQTLIHSQTTVAVSPLVHAGNVILTSPVKPLASVFLIHRKKSNHIPFHHLMFEKLRCCSVP